MTVAAFLDDWLEGQRQHLKETTWSSYDVAAKRIKGGLGASKLKALAPLDIENFYADLAEGGSRSDKPLSAKSVRNTHVVLRKALADAERLGLIPRNAAAAAKPPSRLPRRANDQRASWSGSIIPVPNLRSRSPCGSRRTTQSSCQGTYSRATSCRWLADHS